MTEHEKSRDRRVRPAALGLCGGAYAAQAGKVSHLQGFPVHVVDTIGSGDAHAGGVLAGLASGFTLAEAVLLGNAVASWVTAQEGAATAPQAAELRARHLLDI